MILGGGVEPAESGHYRFLSKQVYRHAQPAMIAKSLRHKPIRFGGDGTCGTIARSSEPECAAQYVSRKVIKGAGDRFAATDLHTTLVLGRQAPDFSTDAGNSALIVTMESPRRLWRQL
jgi:hypothetical protein